MLPEAADGRLSDPGVESGNVHLDVRLDVVHGGVEGGLDPGSHLRSLVIPRCSASAVEAEPHDVLAAVADATKTEHAAWKGLKELFDLVC